MLRLMLVLVLWYLWYCLMVNKRRWLRRRLMVRMNEWLVLVLVWMLVLLGLYSRCHLGRHRGPSRRARPITVEVQPKVKGVLLRKFGWVWSPGLALIYIAEVAVQIDAALGGMHVFVTGRKVACHRRTNEGLLVWGVTHDWGRFIW